MSDEDAIKLALEHSRALFVYHAGQRILSLNYYFVAIAVFLSGFGFLAASSLTTNSRALIGLALAIAGIFLTHCFRSLDRRNEQLVDCNKKLLRHVEGEMAKRVGCDEWNITASADDAPHLHWRYRFIVPRIFYLYMLLSGVGGLFSILLWATQQLCCP